MVVFCEQVAGFKWVKTRTHLTQKYSNQPVFSTSLPTGKKGLIWVKKSSCLEEIN